MMSPFAMVDVVYIDDTVLASRMRDAYRNMLLENHERVVEILKNTIRDIRTKPIPLEDQTIVLESMGFIYRALVNMSRKNFSAAHDNIREAFYMAENKHYGDGASDNVLERYAPL